MTILDDFVTAFVTAGIGQVTSDTGDWRLRIGYIQADPDRSICVYDSPGPPPEAGQPVEYPKVQVRLRGAPDDFQALRDKADGVFRLLHSCDAPAVLGATYVWCYAAQSGPLPLGQDENRRPELAYTFRVMKTNGA